MFVSFVPLLKFWLTFGDKTNDLDRSSPRMLNFSSVLNFNKETFVFLSWY